MSQPQSVGSATVASLLGPDGAADRIVPGWEARPAQLRLAEEVYARLTEGGHVVVEAPTGVGKTLGYLVPAVLSGRRVIVSTNTKTLQEQIVHKDLPALAKIVAEAGLTLVRASPEDEGPPPAGEVRYALMKGRSNYLCLDRLYKRRRQRAFDFDSDLLGDITQWAEETVRGDRAELIGLGESSTLWNELDARSEICHGSRCESFERCFITRMRREASGAHIIIVNHHLLMADLSLKAQASVSSQGRSFGEVIPSGDALIVDEAHALEEIASEYFGGQVSTRKLERLTRDLNTFIDDGGARDRALLSLLTSDAVTAATEVFAKLPRQEGRTRLAKGQVGAALQGARQALPKAEEALAELMQNLDLQAASDAGAEGLSRRVEEFGRSLTFVLGAEDPDFVYWSERQPKSASLGASPINVANLLSQFMFGVFEAVALTSATLSTGDSEAKYFRQAVGLGEDTGALILESPFDFESQAALYLPKDAPDPLAQDAAQQLAAHAERLIRLVEGGALFLFTSYRVMHAVHRILKARLPYPVMMQGEAPKGALLERMVQEAPAVLFATASFWEGVDLPGEPLRLVMIDRLPFDPPSDPLLAARAEALEAEGRRAFPSLLVPRAILRLKQGFGRLVRSSQDRGIVAILDRRIQSKSYGKRFLKALPPATRIHDPEALRDWWVGGQRAPLSDIDAAAEGSSSERESSADERP